MDDAELRLLQERAFQLKELAKHPGWAVLEQMASEQMDVRRATLVSGSCGSMEHYSKLVGWLAGAKFVVALPAETLLRLSEQVKPSRAS